MIRLLVIFLFWICTLGVIDIDIRFRDGLHIRFKSWLMWLTGKYKQLPKPHDPRKTSSVPFDEQAYKRLLATEVKPPKEEQ